MKLILGRRQDILAVVLALTLLSPAAWAKGIDDFKLAKAIPADAFLAIHSRDHAGKAFINKQYERVWAEVERVRFDRDLKRMFKAMRQKQLEPGAEIEGFDEQWQRITDLCTSVEWSSLAKREFAMGMKLGFPTVEFVMLMVPPAEKLKDNFEGLSGIFKTIVELAPPDAIKLATEESANTIIHRISFADAPFPFAMTLARHDDVIMVGFGPTMFEQSLALLRGEGGQPLAASPRFQGALQKLPPPADELVFFDVAKLMGQVRQVVGGIQGEMEQAAPAEGEPGHEEYLKWKALPGKIIDAIDMFEYTASVITTDGMKSSEDSVTVYRDDAASHAFYPVLAGNAPISDPLKYVPVGAGEFWVTSGIDLPALYKAVVNIIWEDVPDGEELMAQIEALKDPETGPGIDIEKDIVGWIGGSLISFSVPGPTPYSSAEFVFMLSVRDEAKAREMIGRLFGMIEPMLAQQNGSVVDAEIEGAEGFKSVVFPMLTMLGYKPVLGVKEGWLFIASSPQIITTTLDVAAGKMENFSQNERFLKEGIQPEGRVRSLSFTDQTKLGEELGQALQMVPLIGMMAPDVMKDPVMQSVLSIVGKLGRVVRKLDFFQSSASRTVSDGKVEFTKKITTYREPPVITKPKPPTTEEQPEEGTEEGEPKEPNEG